MKATVLAINDERGFVSVRTDGGITVFELLGGYSIEVGDVIRGNLGSLGGEEFFNETQLEKMSVFVQGVYCSEQNARHLMYG